MRGQFATRFCLLALCLSRVGCVDAECLAVLVVGWTLSVELKWFMVFNGCGACLLMW